MPKITDARVIVTCPGRNFVTLAIDRDDGTTGLGGFAGACGGFIASKSLGVILDRVGSCQPFFIACGLACFVALAVTHRLNPRYAPVQMA